MYEDDNNWLDEQENMYGPTPPGKNSGKRLIVLLLSAVLVLAMFGGTGFFLWRAVSNEDGSGLPGFMQNLPIIRDLSFMPNRQIVSFHEHFGLDRAITQLVLDGERLRDISPPVVLYGASVPQVFLRCSFVREHIDPFVFWDAGAGVLFISSRYEMLEFTPAENSFIIDGRARELSTPLWRDGNDMMIPVEVIHALYAVTVEYHAAYNTVIVNTTDTPRTTALSDVALLDVRYWSHFRSPIATQVPRGEVLTIFDSPDDFEYVRVRTREGLLGYALREELDSFHTGYIPIGREPMLVDFIDNFTAPPQAWTAGRMVNMAWQLGYSPAAFAGRMGENLPDGMNVVSPTFFRIAPGGGYFNSYGYAPYVAWAQAQGIAVWPKVFDVDSVRVAAFLTNRAARQQGIAQLLHYIDTLGLDGINIDFEHLLDPRLGAYKIQFLRELAIPMRMRGATLSAAVLMPMPHNHFYRIDLIGLTVCFVQLMAYDEHWGVDSGAGPNASLPWVSRWSARALELVPAYRLVLGLPFYNRMWREELLTGNLTQQAVGIAWGRTFFEERGVVWEWDAYYASYFGEVLVTEDGIPVRWRVWLECERSMRAKLHLVDVHGLAGTAGWQLGLETPGIWDTINLALGGG